MKEVIQSLLVALIKQKLMIKENKSQKKMD